jgi:N-succinyl-L-ornithine transcarbamylase
MTHFTSVHDVADIPELIRSAAAFKAHPFARRDAGADKRIGLIFMNPSMRTRLSTQIAARNLGLEAIVFDLGSEGWKIELEDGVIMNGTTVEHIRDAAPVLGSYFDIIGIRTFPGLLDRDADYSELFIEQLKRFAGVPVLSLESATLHPLQSLADLLTIAESRSRQEPPKIVLTWAPHMKPLPQCVANSFAQWVTSWMPGSLTIAHPEGYALSSGFTTGATITHNQHEALRDADFVYVKNWSSFEQYGGMPAVNEDWLLTQDRLKITNDAKVMHCLPVRRNLELSDSILDGPSSIITQQAGNRVWAAQAVIEKLLGK